jgi:hypothetical protein
MASLDIKDQTKDEISSNQIEHASLEETLSFSFEEENALVRKIDLTLLPMIWFMYLLSYMDRTKYVATITYNDGLLMIVAAVLGMPRFREWRRI